MTTDKSKQQLFEVAVLHRGEKTTEEVVKPRTVLANDEAHAKLIVTRLDELAEYEDRLDELEVIIHPFHCR